MSDKYLMSHGHYVFDGHLMHDNVHDTVASPINHVRVCVNTDIISNNILRQLIFHGLNARCADIIINLDTRPEGCQSGGYCCEVVMCLPYHA